MTAYQNHDNQINAEENEIFLGVGNGLLSKENYYERFAQLFMMHGCLDEKID